MDAEAGGGRAGELDIRRFDPSTMKPHRISVCIGKRGTGKSILIQDIMYHMRNQLHYGLAMTPTQQSAESFRSYMPASSVYNEYRVDVLGRMLSTQRSRSQERGMAGVRPLFLVLDDCMYDKSVIKGKEIRDLFMNGRHYKMFFVAAVQYLMDLSPALRTQVDYCFALRENVIANRERLYKYFFGIFPSYDDFSRVLDACTANFECLVIDNTVQSNSISDCVFWYKAKHELPPFKLCAPVFWELEKKRNAPQADVQPQQQAQRSMPCIVDSLPRRARSGVQRIVKHGETLPGVG